MSSRAQQAQLALGFWWRVIAENTVLNLAVVLQRFCHCEFTNRDWSENAPMKGEAAASLYVATGIATIAVKPAIGRKVVLRSGRVFCRLLPMQMHWDDCYSDNNRNIAPLPPGMRDMADWSL
jgi:hypothetical protein